MFSYWRNLLTLIVTARIYSCKIPIAFWGISEAGLDIQEKPLWSKGASCESCAITSLNPALSSYEFACHGQSPVAPWVCGTEDIVRKALRKQVARALSETHRYICISIQKISIYLPFLGRDSSHAWKAAWPQGVAQGLGPCRNLPSCFI